MFLRKFCLYVILCDANNNKTSLNDNWLGKLFREVNEYEFQHLEGCSSKYKFFFEGMNIHFIV